MKIVTNIEQSKRLAEFLPIESADMIWTFDFTINEFNGLNIISDNFKPEEEDIPAWSLSALISLLPCSITDGSENKYDLYIEKQGEQYYLSYKGWFSGITKIDTIPNDDFIDVCVEMLIKVSEWKIENE